MSRLKITPRHLAAIERHGASAYPEECCGVLLGRALADGEPGTLVERVLAARNERDESRHNRYVMTPETILAAEKEARSLGLEIVGYYHSHPDHPAVPSQFDRDHAWPRLSYVIVSVEKGRAVVTRSWRLADERDRFLEEKLDAEPSPAWAPGPAARSTEALA